MVRNRIFWTIGEQLYMIDYHITYYRKIMVYRVESMNMGRSHWDNGQWCQWDDSAGTMVSP